MPTKTANGGAVALRPAERDLPVVALENNEDLPVALQEDDWIRKSQFVVLENLNDPQADIAAKKQIMHDFYTVHTDMREKIAEANEQDPILKGLLYQEEYMHSYKQSERSDDKKRALAYKRELLEQFKQRRSASQDRNHTNNNTGSATRDNTNSNTNRNNTSTGTPSGSPKLTQSQAQSSPNHASNPQYMQEL